MPIDESYPSSLTDAEWKVIEPLVPGPKLFGRPPRYKKRAILDAIFYVVRSGCAWRLLPHDLPPWRIVYHYLASAGPLATDAREFARRSSLAQRKKKAPSAAILDSQSVKVSNHGGVRGYDAGKKIMGRKRHILVDTLGLILNVVVHPADIQDRDGAKLVLPVLQGRFGWLRRIFVDGGYAGALESWTKQFGLASRPETRSGQTQRCQQAPLSRSPQALDSRTHLRLAFKISTSRQGLRIAHREQ